MHDELVSILGEETVDATQLAKLFDSRVILSVEQDLELVRQGIKTRNPIKYGHKVKV